MTEIELAARNLSAALRETRNVCNAIYAAAREGAIPQQEAAEMESALESALRHMQGISTVLAAKLHP